MDRTCQPHERGKNNGSHLSEFWTLPTHLQFPARGHGVAFPCPLGPIWVTPLLVIGEVWVAAGEKCGGRKSYAEARPEVVALVRELSAQRM